MYGYYHIGQFDR